MAAYGEKKRTSWHVFINGKRMAGEKYRVARKKTSKISVAGGMVSGINIV